MGYYTEFNIILSKPNDDFINDLEEISKEQFEGNNTFYSTYSKWYDYQDHLMLISKKYPDLIIKIIGYGEQPGDIWCEYWQDGNYYHEDFVPQFTEFSSSLLKPYNKWSDIV